MNEETNIPEESPRLIRVLLMSTVLVLLAGLLLFGIFRNFDALLTRTTPFPVDFHSFAQADYSKDPDFLQFPAVDIKLVVDAIWDQNLSASNLSTRITQVHKNFIASVSSVTSEPTSIEGTTSVETSLTITSTNTGTIYPTTTPTETPLGFIASPTYTPTISLIINTPTDTQILPTHTSAPPTSTISPTNTVSPCGQLSLSSFSASSKKATWDLNNTSSTTVKISSISISWPASNTSMDKMFFGSGKIWDGTAAPPSTDINSGWTSSSRDLAGGASKRLEFTFTDQTASSGYNINITFENGCSISKSN